jgi:transposase
MARKRKTKRKSVLGLPILRPDAAGVDIGAHEIYVAVPADRDRYPVRCFTTFTRDLHALADWLQECRIQSVAMESTGVYWIPLFQILEARGFEVCLVNARYVKNVPGRKSDVSDCQWLQYLHAVGLLRASFRPPQEVCQVRSLLRHRESLVQMAAVHVQHMQKALDQMNVQIHHVISDLTGRTGMAIMEAILAGERDPEKLAQLRDPHIRASSHVVAQSLVGDYRREHLFTLRQSLAAYRHYHTLMMACDQEIEACLGEFDSQVDCRKYPLPPARDSHRKPRGNEMHFDLRCELYRILGVDLTQVPGLNALTVHTVLAEIGPDLSAFPGGAAFASWLGLCPDNRISGGQILSVRTRPVRNRVALALRQAAQSLHHSQSYLGIYYRRLRAKLGAPKAITAAAHKLARIVFHLLTTRQEYDESVFAEQEASYRKRTESRLRRQARALGFQLLPVTAQICQSAGVP